MKIKSVKRESILRQYYIYFLVASVLPLITLIYIVFQFATVGKVNTNLNLLMTIAAALLVLGFWGTRSFIIKIVSLSNKLKTDDLKRMDRSVILELAKGEGEIANLARVFSDVTAKLEENVKKLEEAKKTLYRILSKVGSAVGSVENFDLLIRFILETTVESLGAQRGAIFSLDEENGILRIKAAVGIDDKNIVQQVKIGEEAVGWVAKEKRSLFIPNLGEKKGDLLFSSPLIATPLIIHDKVLGVISLSGKKGEENFSDDELKIFTNLAYQIAVSFENAKLNVEAERTYFETISALALAVEAKDPYSRGHSERVAEYACKIAEKLGLTQEDLKTLRDACRLHDIGKIGISDSILKKPSSLSPEETEIMHGHPLIGERIVNPLKSFRHILDPIRHHHEFLDGSGYPDGLKAENIPLVTRVLTIADIFDALVTERPYRKAFSIDAAKREFEAMVEKGKLDKDVVNALFNLIEEKKI